MSADHHVTLTIPADGAYLSILRTATAGVAARLDFTLDGIEDLRMAVDEACALLLPQSKAESNLRCAFDVGETSLTIAVTAESSSPKPPRRDGFAWTVLTALTTDVDATVDGSSVTLRLTREREGYELP
ncbi:MAG: anti-sigma factor [Nocardioidaceae bacterium]